jgi:hypothetical protein
MTYLIEWHNDLGDTYHSKKVQYLPEIADVVRKAFGEDRAEIVAITRIKETS